MVGPPGPVRVGIDYSQSYIYVEIRAFTCSIASLNLTLTRPGANQDSGAISSNPIYLSLDLATSHLKYFLLFPTKEICCFANGFL